MIHAYIDKYTYFLKLSCLLASKNLLFSTKPRSLFVLFHFRTIKLQSERSRLVCQRSVVKIPAISCLNPSVQIKRSMREIMRFERSMGEIFNVTISISDQVQCFRDSHIVNLHQLSKIYLAGTRRFLGGKFFLW